MKRSVLLALVLILFFTMVSTHSEGLTESAENFDFEMIMQYMPGIAPVNGTDYVIVTEKFTHFKSLYTTSGERLAAFQYDNLGYYGFDLFAAFNDNDVVNNRALVTSNGLELIGPEYGNYKPYSVNWVIGYTLSPTDVTENTYKRGNDYFNIDRYDVFYIDSGDNSCARLASLSSEEFKAVDVHGDYIAIMDADDQITVYDKDFNPYEYQIGKVSNEIYGVTDYVIINNADGEQVIDGFAVVRELKVNSGLWLLGTCYNFKGQKITGIIDTQGNVIMPAEYALVAVTDKYAVVANAEGLKGLYAIDTNQLIVPCEFNNIMVGKVSTDNYVHNGYVGVENGDLRGYYDTVAGKLSCEVKYDRNSVTTIGCSTFWKVEDGVYMLAAADGVETEVRVDAIETTTRGDGYLLLAQKDAYYGLIDWHGNVVLPFEHYKPIAITDDSRAIIRTSTGLRIDKIVR